MVVGLCKIKMRASWVSSLKEKRMVVKSILARTQNKFNVSISEVEAMDIHQTIIIGLGIVTNAHSVADSMMDQIINFIENETEAEVLDVEVEIMHCQI